MKGISKIACLLLFVILTACTEEARRRLEPTPIAIGSINQLAVITDKTLWKSSIGDSINFYFGSPYPILPQPEPLFDLKHFNVAELYEKPTRLELKAYLIVADLDDTDSPTTQMVMEDLGPERIRRAKEDPSFATNVGRDRWAMDQVIIYLFGYGEEKLKKHLIENFPAIAKVVQSQYQEQIDATAYLGGTNNQAINQIRAKMGLYLKVPIDYTLTLEQDKTVWLKRETDVATSNILLHVVPYKNQGQFSKEQIIALRDSLGKALISSTIEGSYMRTNPIDLPVLTQTVDLANAYAVEARGIWEMEGDFLGGPFSSYLILNEKDSELIFIDAFVLAPSERKRNFMLSLEHIVKSLSLEVASN